MNSLSRRFLISVGLMSLVVTILGSIGAFVVFQRELTNRQIAYLSDYVRERSSNIDRRFTNLTNLHKAAGVELERRMNHLSDADVNRLTDDYFPAKGDGTRRSRDELFEGHLTASGRWDLRHGRFHRTGRRGLDGRPPDAYGRLLRGLRFRPGRPQRVRQLLFLPARPRPGW